MATNYNYIELDSLVNGFNKSSRDGKYLAERKNENYIVKYAESLNRQAERAVIESVKSRMTVKDVFDGNLPSFDGVSLEFDYETYTFTLEHAKHTVSAEKMYAAVPAPKCNLVAIGYSLMALVNVPLVESKDQVAPIEKVLSIKEMKSALQELTSAPVTSQVIRDAAHFLKVSHAESGKVVNIFVKPKHVRKALREALSIRELSHVYEAPSAPTEAVKTVETEKKKG